MDRKLRKNMQALSKRNCIVLITVLLAVLTVYLAVCFFSSAMERVAPRAAFKVGFYLMGVFVLLMILLSLSLEYQKNDRCQAIFFAMLLTVIADLMSYVVNMQFRSLVCSYLIFVVSLLVSPVVCMLFWFYQRIGCLGKNYPKTCLDALVLLLGAADVVLILYGSATGKMFHLDEALHYSKGPWNVWTYLYPFAVLILCFVMTFFYKIGKRRRISYLLFTSCPLVMGILALISNDTIFSHSANFLEMLIIYMDLQIFKNYEITEQKAEVQKTRTNAIMLQMNPHFIQNCLSSIRGLMYVDAQYAEKMLVNLSGYLRGTFSHLNDSGMVTVREELALVDYYLSIEQARFPGTISVEKQIELPDFLIPTFLIEPLVENAVRHGIREKGEAGRVCICVLDRGEYVEITVEDDGVGFDVDAPITDGKSHIGLKNVKSRIALMTNGTFRLESQIGKGTKATIRLPKEGQR